MILVQTFLIGLNGSDFFRSENNLNINSQVLRENDFLHLSLSRANYGYHEPLNTLCTDYNNLFVNIDFNISIKSIQQK